MNSNREDDSVTVGCLLFFAGIGIAGGVWAACSWNDPRCLWALPVAAVLFWVVFVIHKDAIKPTCSDSQIEKLRMEKRCLEEKSDRLDQALSGFKWEKSAEKKVESIFARERKSLNELQTAITLEKQKFEVARLECEDLQSKEKAAFNQYRETANAEIKAADESMQSLWEKCWEERSAGYPSLARQYADAWVVARRKDLDSLKSHAIKTAELRQKIGRELRDVKASEIVHRNLVRFYESMFPLLVDFKEGEVPTLADIAKDEDDTRDGRKGWLSDEEWDQLSDVDRSQLALDRYCARQKTKWEIGLEYERFCGFRLEKQGWDVRYHGAVCGLDDLGRDLVCRKPGKALVVQCKNWSASKQIHEKHVFQTFGTMMALRLDEPGNEVKGWLVTSTKLSDRARKFANLLEISVKENDKLGVFPRIKCNAKSTQGDVYHLPFDQQYDRIVMRPEKGDFYCLTAQEAATKGFRRAGRWFG